MTYHLTPDERIDALDGVLAAERRDHLTACPRCQQELADLQDVANTLVQVGADDVPEPSPLFWTHLERRVAGAVETAHEAARPMPWWRGSARAWGALAAAAVLVLAVGLPSWWTNRAVTDDALNVEAEMPAGVSADMSGASVQWEFVVNVLGTLEPADVQAVLGPSSRRAVDAAFDSLTAGERDAFARLLQAELMEGSN